MVRRVVAPLIFARAVTATIDPTELRRSVQHTMDVCSPAYGVSPHELERAIVEGREDDLYERAIPSKKLMTCHDAVLTDPEAMYPLSLSKRFAARSKYRYGPRKNQRNEDPSSSLGYTGIGGGLTTLGLAFHGLRQAFGGRKEPPLKQVGQMSLPPDFTPIQELFYSDHSESEDSDDESKATHFAIATPRPAAIPIHTPRRVSESPPSPPRRRTFSAASQRPSHVPRLLLPPQPHFHGLTPQGGGMSSPLAAAPFYAGASSSVRSSR